MNLLPLQSILPKKVYLNNIIVGRQRDASFFVDNKEYAFSFTFPLRDYKPAVFFKIKLSDHTLWLSLDQLPPLSYFSQKFEGVDLQSLPEDIQAVALEACFKNVLDAVEEELGVVISIESYEQNHPGNNFDDELPFSVRIEGIELPIHGALHMEGSSLEFLAALLERPSYTRKNHFTAIEVPIYAIIGEETLSLKEFKNLDLRDILLLEDENFVANGSCKVVIGNYLMYGGVLENGTLTLENLMDERVDNDSLYQDASYDFDDEGDMDDDISLEDEEAVKNTSANNQQEEFEDEEKPSTQGQIPKEMADIPIQIVFEVGQKHLPIKELQSLKPGFTFELENPAERPITIRANGKVIGTGELLKVGDRVGVRVTSFSNK